LIKEFQYPDGWYMRVGQIYSSPYEPNHFLVTRFEQDDAPGANNILVYYKEVDSNNYDEIVVEKEQCHRAWYVNEGNWDLEREPKTISFENGSSITMLNPQQGIRGKQSSYLFGFDSNKEE
jgi:hypothetical protein